MEISEIRSLLLFSLGWESNDTTIREFGLIVSIPTKKFK
jgi:hypothetical protein